MRASKARNHSERQGETSELLFPLRGERPYDHKKQFAGNIIVLSTGANQFQKVVCRAHGRFMTCTLLIMRAPKE